MGCYVFFSLVNLSMDVTWSQPRPVLAELRRRHVEVELRTSESMWGFWDVFESRWGSWCRWNLDEYFANKYISAWVKYDIPRAPMSWKFWRCKSVSVTSPKRKQGRNSCQNKGPILGWFGRIMIMTLLELICFCQRVAVSTKKKLHTETYCRCTPNEQEKRVP